NARSGMRSRLCCGETPNSSCQPHPHEHKSIGRKQLRPDPRPGRFRPEMNLAPPSPAVFLLLAFFSFALAILVLFMARSGSMRNYFSLFAVSNAVWLGSGFLLYSDIDPQRGLLWARVAFAAGALLILSLYHVLMLFPDEASLPFGRSINCVGGVLALLSLFSPLLAREVTTISVFKLNVIYGPLFLP